MGSVSRGGASVKQRMKRVPMALVFRSDSDLVP
jgi:hypothetical protein